jgi:hypothetical protein
MWETIMFAKLLRAATVVAVASFLSADDLRADSFELVDDRSEFVSLVDGRELRHPGVRLEVMPDGEIRGRGLGVEVTGDWSWRGNYFCRDLQWGSREIGYNCQAVLRNGSTLRFVADQGQGQSADFRLR